MPTNRLIFFLFFIVLVGAVIYALKAPETPSTSAPMTLSRQEYIQQVERDRQERAAERDEAQSPAGR